MDQAALHNAYAAEYDGQIPAYECYLAEALFGLCYEYVRPGETLLDLGIGSGLSAAPFAKAGLQVYGMDFSESMLDLCRAKGIAVELRRHDLQNIPWPYDNRAFDHVICCGVMHFIAGLDALFAEAARLLRPGGLFAFTIKWPAVPNPERHSYEQVTSDGLDVFAHSLVYVADLLRRNRLQRAKTMRCFVGEDIFSVHVSRNQEAGA
jgi:predicted TPR repeat methyltransferase